MSSPEYAELRGLSGVAVAQRAAILGNASKRSLIWFLHGISLAPGGLKQLARELLKTFPERIGSPTMHKLGTKSGKTYSPDDSGCIESELESALRMFYTDVPVKSRKAEEMLELCRCIAEHGNKRARIPSIVGFLVDLSINPRLQFSVPGESSDAMSTDVNSALEEFSSLHESEFHTAGVPYFQDIVAALFELKRRHEKAAREDFQMTTVARAVWQTLDFALKAKKMVLVDGLEGRGKTEATKAWCGCHLGEARFVSLKGITSKTTAFREIAKALGVASSYTRTATEMQARIEDVLQRSQLMLVIDEAHWLFNQSQRIYSRPELIDWIGTALCNQSVPVGLVTTPTFLTCMNRAADQVGWNWRQFRRRVKRYVVLPEKNSAEDVQAVARRLLPGASSSAVKLVVGYTALSKRDLSAVGDVAEEARLLAEEAGAATVTFEHIETAINDHLIPSDTAFAERLRSAHALAGKTQAEPPLRVEEHAPDSAVDRISAGHRAPRIGRALVPA